MSNAVDKTLHLSAPPERVWKALTDPDELGGWFPDETDLEPRVGASGWFDWSAHGKYAVRIEEMDPPRKLVWTWARDKDTPLDEGARTRVEWTLVAREDGGTDLHLRESGFSAPKYRQENDAGWDKELGELAEYLERVGKGGVPTDATRSQVHEEVFPADPERLFAILHTPSAIRQWWGAARAVVLAQNDGVWAAAWGESEDDPDYITAASITDFEPPRRMVLTDYRYRSREGGLPFEADFVTEFRVAPHADGASLRVSQDGFPEGPEADDFYAATERGWKDTFAGIRRYLESTGGREAEA